MLLVRRFSSKVKRKAVAFDIDGKHARFGCNKWQNVGVLIRGAQALPGAADSLRRLESANIPFIKITNGGGITEAEKALKLSKQIQYPVRTEQVVLCHTPMQHLPDKSGMTLVIGPETCREVVKTYGFQNIIMPLDLLSWNPSIWPFRIVSQSKPTFDTRSVPISRILVCHDSRDWALDIQVICDVLRSDSGRHGTLSPHHHTPKYRQSVPIYFSNCDFTWANDFSVPRFAQGAFRRALERLYEELTGHHLQAEQEFGKPFDAMYRYAVNTFDKMAPLADNEERKIYAIGDNISSDIVGANMAGWTSILVKTGVWQEGDVRKSASQYHLPKLVMDKLSADDLRQIVKPQVVVDNVQDAVEWIMKQ